MSLKYRIALIIFMLEAIMMGFVLWNTLGYSLQSNQKLLTANELAMLNVISNNGRVALVTEEYADFQPYLEEILKDPRVEKAILVDQARRVVASTHSSDIGNMQPDFNRTIDDDRYWRVQEMRNASGLLGVMALEFSDKAIKQIYSESRNLGVFIAAIGMLLIAVVGLAVGFVLTRRLEILTETAQRIAQGDMTTSAGIQGRDEVGILAHTMNTMAETISRRSREREALIHQLEAQNDELERYTYTVSHDLKSPVVTIKGFLGLLESDLAAGNADKVEDDLDRIGAAADKMYGLLDDLLELSRIGRVINDPVELGFNQLVDEMLLAYENNMATGEVTVNVHDNLPVVHGDRMRLMEVLQNLLDNAIKYRRPDIHPVITIGCDHTPEGEVFYVEDNGVGIPEGHREKIFGLFERLQVDTMGTGIGLAIVKRIIEFHQGRVWVENAADGQGSRFCFTLNEFERDDK